MPHPSDLERWPPRPAVSPRFYKAHGLGNDYLVFEAADDGEGREGADRGWLATPANVALVCDPHRGPGSDGIVVVSEEATPGADPTHADVALRMFNPDGGEFERSGNGLRVLASFLARHRPELRTIDASVGGGEVRMRVHGIDAGRFDISVEMGAARTGPGAVDAGPGLLGGDGPTYAAAGPAGERLEVVPVSVGNPHVVVLADGAEPAAFSEARLAVVGPYLATHPEIRYGTNVQLARAVDGRAEAFIWERGVGRTSASGTSSCAVAVALVLAGRLPAGEVSVEMPGGTLTVTVDEELEVVLRGPVESVMSGTLEAGLLATFEPGP